MAEDWLEFNYYIIHGHVVEISGLEYNQKFPDTILTKNTAKTGHDNNYHKYGPPNNYKYFKCFNSDISFNKFRAYEDHEEQLIDEVSIPNDANVKCMILDNGDLYGVHADIVNIVKQHTVKSWINSKSEKQLENYILDNYEVFKYIDNPSQELKKFAIDEMFRQCGWLDYHTYNIFEDIAKNNATSEDYLHFLKYVTDSRECTFETYFAYYEKDNKIYYEQAHNVKLYYEEFEYYELDNPSQELIDFIMNNEKTSGHIGLHIKYYTKDENYQHNGDKE